MCRNGRSKRFPTLRRRTGETTAAANRRLAAAHLILMHRCNPATAAIRIVLIEPGTRREEMGDEDSVLGSIS